MFSLTSSSPSPSSPSPSSCVSGLTVFLSLLGRVSARLLSQKLSPCLLFRQVLCPLCTSSLSILPYCFLCPDQMREARCSVDPHPTLISRQVSSVHSSSVSHVSTRSNSQSYFPPQLARAPSDLRPSPVPSPPSPSQPPPTPLKPLSPLDKKEAVT